MKLPRRQFLHLAVCAALPAMSRIARAETYPSRPVHLIVPLAPAGASDITARLIGQWLSERLGQQFVIDNRCASSLLICFYLFGHFAPSPSHFSQNFLIFLLT